jgi:hypothetical protein
VSQNQPRQVQVYNPHTPTRCPPDFIIPRDTAREWVFGGLANWINASRAIRLVELVLALRGESCKPGAALIFRNAISEIHAVAVIEGWRPGRSPAASPDITQEEEVICGPYSTHKNGRDIEAA